MGRYVHQEMLGNHRAVGYQLHIFEESPKEFRPIVTAINTWGYAKTYEGYSDRRSFGSKEEAYKFFKENERLLCRESLKDLDKNLGRKSLA